MSMRPMMAGAGQQPGAAARGGCGAVCQFSVDAVVKCQPSNQQRLGLQPSSTRFGFPTLLQEIRNRQRTSVEVYDPHE